MLLHCNASCCTSTFSLVSSSLRRHDHPEDSQDTVIRRRHNARSLSLFTRHNQNLKQNKNLNESQETFVPPRHDDDDRSKLLELSLVTRRTPQFPGSIYAQSASDPDIASSLPSLRKFLGSDGDEDEGEGESEREMIAKALEIRRKVTKEIIKESLVRKGKFGITYATNVTDRLGEFVDHVMIEAAALKRLPEYSETRFNIRARTVIEDSNFVPLVRSSSFLLVHIKRSTFGLKEKRV